VPVQETIVDEVFIKKMDEYRQPDKSVGLIEACSKNVVVFAQHMLGIRLYAWQVYFLNRLQTEMAKPDGQREFVAMTGRQQGKSVGISIFDIWATVFNKYPKGAYNNTTSLIVSASDVQARKLLNEMKKLMILGDRHMTETYRDEDDKPMFGEEFFTSLLSDKDPNNTTVISFKPHNESTHGKFILAGSKHGSTIKSYAATSSVLGETAGIILVDEAGKTDRISDEFYYEFLYPVGNSTNALRIAISTAWVPNGFFYRMVDPDDMYETTDIEKVIFTIDSIKLENPEYYNVVMKTVNNLILDGKKDEVQRAYYCRFVKGEQSYFDPDDVRAVFNEDEKMLDVFSKPCDLGLDFGGQVKSRTVITISYLDEENVAHRIYHCVYEIGKDLNLVNDILELKKRFNIQRIIYDDCPAAFTFVQQMNEKGWDLQPMSFRSEKISRYGAFRASMKRGKIKSYIDDDLKTEMYALEHTPGSRQSNIQHAPGYSDDMLDSFLMSVYFYIDDETSVMTFEW
jgi:hypothetical protein